MERLRLYIIYFVAMLLVPFILAFLLISIFIEWTAKQIKLFMEETSTQPKGYDRTKR